MLRIYIRAFSLIKSQDESWFWRSPYRISISTIIRHGLVLTVMSTVPVAIVKGRTVCIGYRCDDCLGTGLKVQDA